MDLVAQAGDAAAQALVVDYPRSSAIGSALRIALSPLPPSQVRSVCLDWVQNASVHYCDKQVCKVCYRSAQRFKRVSVCVQEDATLVRSNMIYWQDRRGVGGAQGEKGRARGSKRATWRLLASVDFAQHGTATPGHWHLNCTAAGTILNHCGPNGETWHGPREPGRGGSERVGAFHAASLPTGCGLRPYAPLAPRASAPARRRLGLALPDVVAAHPGWLPISCTARAGPAGCRGARTRRRRSHGATPRQEEAGGVGETAPGVRCACGAGRWIPEKAPPTREAWWALVPRTTCTALPSPRCPIA